MDEKPKSGFERYDEMLNNDKMQKRIRNGNDLVSAAIGIIGWICLLVGILDFFAKDSSWQEGLVCIVGAMFLFGFSIIVKAACKYLDKQ